MTELVRMQSWVKSANNPETEFPLNNLPYGVFSHEARERRLGVAIGKYVLDLREVAGELPLRGTADRQAWMEWRDGERSASLGFPAFSPDQSSSP